MKKKKGISNSLVIGVVIVIIVIGVAVFILTANHSGGGATTTSTTISSTATGTSTTGSMTTTTSSGSTSVQANIVAGGSTFVNPAMQVWTRDFTNKYPGIQVTYSAVGSGAGNNNFLQGVYDIGATDVPPPSNLYQQMVQKYGKILIIPDVVGGVGIIYNLPGFNGTLNLNADTLAKIYLGQIQYWDDPAIKQLNPNYNFPHQKIVAVHRSDGSGTTYIFTSWLYVSSAAWRNSSVGYGFTVNWPVDSLGNGLGGKGSDGVTAYVKQNQYSIGYVEVQYAIVNNLKTATVQNPATGEFVSLTIQSVENAVNNANASQITSLSQDLSKYLGVFLNVKANNAYPIVTFSWLVVKADYSDMAKAEAIYLFLKYIATDGQNALPQGYLPVPQNIQQLILQNLQQITYNGQPIYTMVS